MSTFESAQVQSAVAAVAAGSSVSAAARAYKVSRSSINRAMRRRGLPRGEQRLSAKSLQAAAMMGNGHDPKDVASKLGVSLSTVYRAEHRVAQLASLHTEEQRETTPLLAFIRALNEVPERLEAFVASLEVLNGKPTTGLYLYQLAGNPRPNPTLRLANAIVHQSEPFARAMGVEPISFSDLLVGQAPSASRRHAKRAEQSDA